MTYAVGRITTRFAATGSQEKGFTLLELAVVVLIIVLVLGLSYPSMSRGTSMLHMQTAGRDVLSALRFAREKAISEQTEVRLIVNRREQKLILVNVLDKPLREYALPSDVKIRRLVKAKIEIQGDVMTVRFLPNGNLESVGIQLRSDGGTMLQIVSDPISGGAHIEPVWDLNDSRAQ